MRSYFLKAVMIAVQYRTRVLEINGVVAARGPRQAEDPIQPATGNRSIR